MLACGDKVISNVETSEKRIPPYLPYRTMETFWDSLKQGVPGRIDRSVMNTFSGSVQAQIISSIKYLGLTDDKLNTKQLFHEIVNAEGANKRDCLQTMLKSAYPFLFNDFNLANATSTQLNDKFREAGASGESVRKCVLFFTTAAKEAGVELSPYVAGTTRIHGDPKTKRTTRKPVKPTPQPSHVKSSNVEDPKLTWNKMLLAKFPNFNPEWGETVQAKWLDSFGRLMDLGTGASLNEAEDPSGRNL